MPEFIIKEGAEMPAYSFEGLTPVVHATAFVHETAVLIGDVWIGEGCYIGPNAVLRGDFGRVTLGNGANFQDTCVAHSFPGRDCIVEDGGHIGHGTVLHGCTIQSDALVGMNSVLMDEVVIGEESIVGAMAFVRHGFSCPPRSLVVGAPAKVIRGLAQKEVNWKKRGTQEYQDLVVRSNESLRQVTPLESDDLNRPRVQSSGFSPKQES
ncbi:MAG TPA: phenylacetic acid degradation protein PaaY [Xanthomonadales bacterium]|nr:phenylacetic acid degradation protein PaaY [Xanthomonadales bacterium]